VAYRLLNEALSQPGIEKQTQDRGEQIKVQIESLIPADTIRHMNARDTKKTLPEVANEVLGILS
jgi:hypothetical protein